MANEKKTEYGFNLVENKNGPTLGYCPDSGVKIIEKDGLYFKDFLGDGEPTASFSPTRTGDFRQRNEQRISVSDFLSSR